MESDALRQAAALGAEGNRVPVDALPLYTIELRKLRHATVLALEGNFRRAAVKLNITSSALTQSIARLERELGVVLFDRGKSGAKLSRTGRQFIGRFEKLLSEARGLAHDLARASSPHSGEVIFGIRPNAARIFLAELLQQVANEAPQLQVKIAITINEVLLEYMLLEGLEFAICDMDVSALNDRLSSKKIARVPMGFYVRSGHPLLNRETVTLNEVRAFPTASPVLTDQNATDTRAWLGLADAEVPSGTVWCDDYAYIIGVALGSDAVLLAPSLAVVQEVATGQLKEVNPRGVRQPRQCDLYLITLPDRSLSPPAAMLVAKIETLIAEKLALISASF